MLELNTILFLKELTINNNKEWFQDNRNRYEISKENFIEYCDRILTRLKEIQPNLIHTNIKSCILRINRDIRFSKDKSPYKNYFAAGFGPGGKSSGLMDFYFQLQPDASFLGGGIWDPSSANLAKFRQEIDYSPQNLKGIIFDEKFSKQFGEPKGSKLKKAPKGYDENHPDIELLKQKETFYVKYFTDSQLLKPNSELEVFESCTILKPYLDYVNHIFFNT